MVKRTQAALSAKGQPVSAYAAYFTLPSRWHLWLMYGFGALFQKLAGHPWGRTLLLRYPALFSNGCRLRALPQGLYVLCRVGDIPECLQTRNRGARASEY